MLKQPSKRNILGQPSWTIRTPRIEAHVTEAGGHLGPVTFDRAGRKLQPFSIAPWATEKIDPKLPTLLKALRGDFFCLPFGGNDTPYRGEQHPPHGETANSRWTFESLDRNAIQVDAPGTTLHLSLQTKVRKGIVDKFITLPHDHDAIYQQHVISKMSGPMSLGHHAMLKFPDDPTDAPGSGVLTTSRFIHGQVFTAPVERPENRGYSILKPGAIFTSLTKVPTITGEMTDLSRYPARRGFEDIVMLVADDTLPFAWTAVTFPQERYVWFALKNPRVLRSTVLWLSNGGRHYAPWNGRHTSILGLEEVTANFHSGLAESAQPNALSRQGIPTHLKLSARKPLTVNYTMAIATIPQKFDRVAKIIAENGCATLISTSGIRMKTRVRVEEM